MANLNLFTHPGTFRRMKPEYLIAWLVPARQAAVVLHTGELVRFA